MQRFLSLFGLTLLLVGAGCEPECATPQNAESFEVGTGELCFERVTDQATVPLMEGPQGGYHVWLAVGCADCGPEVRIRTLILDAGTGDELGGESEHFAELDGSSWSQQAGIQLSMPGDPWDTTNPPLPEGTAFVVVVAFVDPAGTVLHESEVQLIVGETLSWDCEEDC